MGLRNTSSFRAVIFDYGEVLCHPPTEQEIARMASAFAVGPSRFRQLWHRDRGLYDRGDISAGTYWSQVAEGAGVKLDPEQLEQVCQWDVEMWAHENPAMVEWAGQIRSHGMKTAILSNMHPDMVTYVRRSFAWIDSFDHHTFSAEVGLIKPEPAIYEHSLKGVGVEAREALFLDDREANVQAARDCGISAIQFQSLAQLREDLRKLSFPVLPSAGNPSPRLLP